MTSRLDNSLEGYKLIAFLIASYVAGTLLTGIALIVDFIWWLVCCVPGADRLGFFSLGKVGLDIDLISRKSANHGDVLFKMFAEATAAENLLVAYVIVLIETQLGNNQTLLSYFNCMGMYLMLGVVIVTCTFRIAAVSVRTSEWAASLNSDGSITKYHCMRK